MFLWFSVCSHRLRYTLWSETLTQHLHHRCRQSDCHTCTWAENMEHCAQKYQVCVCVELHCRSVLCKMRIEDCCSAIKVINTHKLCHLHQNTHSYTFMCKASQRMNLPVIIYLHLFCGGGTQSNSCRPQTVCEVYLEMVNSLINGSDTSYQVLSCGTVCVPNFWVACGQCLGVRLSGQQSPKIPSNIRPVSLYIYIRVVYI